MPSISGDTARTSPAQELFPSKTRACLGTPAARRKAVAVEVGKAKAMAAVKDGVEVEAEVVAVVVGETAGQPADNHP